MKQATETSAYYRRREADQLKMAETAATEAVQKIHMALAEKYRSLAQEAEDIEQAHRVQDR